MKRTTHTFPRPPVNYRFISISVTECRHPEERRQPGLRLTPIPGGCDKDPTQTPAAPEIRPDQGASRAQTGRTGLQGLHVVQGAADPPRPPLAPHWEPSAVSPSHQSTPFPTEGTFRGVTTGKLSYKHLCGKRNFSELLSEGTAECGGQQGADEGSGRAGRASTSCPGAAVARRC